MPKLWLLPLALVAAGCEARRPMPMFAATDYAVGRFPIDVGVGGLDGDGNLDLAEDVLG